jgi:hypothetical protein
MKSPGLAIFDITKNNFLNFNIENYTHRVKDLAPDVNISENLVYNVGENYFNKSITEVFFISTEHNKSVIADYFNKTYLMPGQQYYEYKIIFGYVGSSNNLHHYIYFFYQSN